MSLLTTLLGSSSGGGSGTVTDVILLSALVGTVGTNLTATQSGAGPGATLTNSGAQAAFAVDGVTPAVGSRILVKDQSSASQNGVYTLTVAGDGTHNWVLTRATDFNQPSQIAVGVEIVVASGTVNAGTTWIQTATVNTVDTDAITFVAQSVVGLTASRAVVTNSAGKLAVSATTSTEEGYLSGVTSAIQTQLNAKMSQSAVEVYAADSGSANAYAVTLSPVPAGYTAGMVVRFKAANANTTASTINVNSLGIKNITKRYNAALVANDILANAVITAVYDGTEFQIMNELSTTAVTPASYTNTNLTVDSYGRITTASSGTAGIPYTDQTTTPVTLAVNNGYSPNNAGLVTLNMPATVAVGSIFVIKGYGAGGWLVQMNTGQVVNLGSSASSSAGSLASSNRYDCVTIYCAVANTTFTATADQGNITVA